MEKTTSHIEFFALPTVSGRYEVCASDTGRPVAVRPSRVAATNVATNLTRASREGRLSEAFVSLRGSR
jgi:hypothetical protein